MPNVDEKMNNLTDLWSQLRRLARLHGEYLRLVMMEKLKNIFTPCLKHYNMYTDRNTIYSDPGKYLIGKNKIGFQFPLPGDFIEYDINFNDLKLVGNMFYYNDNLFVQKYNKN